MSMTDPSATTTESDVRIEVQGATLQGLFIRASHPAGVVIFAHGSGSSHQSPRNQAIARMLGEHGFHALLSDLLTEDEAAHLSNRFDLRLLSHRLNQITLWMEMRPDIGELPFAYFGASTGAAAALMSALDQPRITTVISRGGRPDLVMNSLDRIRIPVLMIVGELDFDVLRLNRQALGHLKEVGQLHVVPGASHLFPEPGALDRVGDVSLGWLNRHLRVKPASSRPGASPEPLGETTHPSDIAAPPTRHRPTHP
jgi:putative phosphoribosyl transferase